MPTIEAVPTGWNYGGKSPRRLFATSDPRRLKFAADETPHVCERQEGRAL